MSVFLQAFRCNLQNTFSNTRPLLRGPILPLSRLPFYQMPRQVPKITALVQPFSTQVPEQQRAGRDNNNASGLFSSINTGTITKASGSGLLLLLGVGLGAYFYCEKNPEQEICDSIRSKLGLKKK